MYLFKARKIGNDLHSVTRIILVHRHSATMQKYSPKTTQGSKTDLIVFPDMPSVAEAKLKTPLLNNEHTLYTLVWKCI
jgi:hypothetical protein